MKKNYLIRSTIEKLYDLTNGGKDIARCKNLTQFENLASAFGNNAIQGKVFGENFYDFLFIDCGSHFNIETVRPSTDEEDVKQGKDAHLGIARKERYTQYKFMRGQWTTIDKQLLEGFKNIPHREPNVRADELVFVANVNKDQLPFSSKNFVWTFILRDDFEHLCNPVFYKRFAEWIVNVRQKLLKKRKDTIRSYKPKKPYQHQTEMRRDAHKRVITNMAFQGAGKTDDQAHSINKGYGLKQGSNAIHIFPFLGLADQNSFGVLPAIIKKYPDLKIINFSSSLDWKIDIEGGFPVEKLSWTKTEDVEKYDQMIKSNTPTYTIGTYAGMARYVDRFIKNGWFHDWYFDEAASLIPGQQVHKLDGLESEAKLAKAFTKLIKYQKKTGGRLHYWEACNITSIHPKAIAFGNLEYFGEYAGHGPYDIQYGVDNNIIADIELVIVEYNQKTIKKHFPNFKEDDPNLIDAYCIQTFNKMIDDYYGYHKTIGYVQSAGNCGPMSEILRNHIPQEFFGSIVGETKQGDRQKALKAFGEKSISATLLNYLCLTLGISENSANGVYMSRNMNDRLLSHAVNRATRRHSLDKPYRPLVKKPIGFLGYGVDTDNHSSLLASELFKQQIHKLFGMGINPMITIVDGQSRFKKDDKVNRPSTNPGQVESLTGNEELKQGVEDLIETVKVEIDRAGFKNNVKTMMTAESFEERLSMLEKVLS